MSFDTSQCARIWTNLRLVTLDPSVSAPYGLLEDHCLGVGGGRILFIGPLGELDLSDFDGELMDGSGRMMTPGLIDCHTHLVFGGHRALDFEERMKGASYEEIAGAGGGILSTVRDTRMLSEDELVAMARPRLAALIDEGATTVEIKSGYGLSFEEEMKMLRAAKRLGLELPVRVRTSLLAAHSVPPEFVGKSDAYVDLICEKMIPRVAEEALADAVDVFCERIAFGPSQAERIFGTARDFGLGIKVHAEQLSNQGGAALAARCGAWSADHLECLDEEGVLALQASGTVSVLLPGAFYYLKERSKPPVDLLRRYGVTMALATDLNPGTSPFASLRLMMNMGCTLFGLTPEEALFAVTGGAAAALGLGRRVGTLSVGKEADMLLWDLEHPAQLACQVGWGRPVQRIFGGEVSHA